MLQEQSPTYKSLIPCTRGAFSVTAQAEHIDGKMNLDVRCKGSGQIIKLTYNRELTDGSVEYLAVCSTDRCLLSQYIVFAQKIAETSIVQTPIPEQNQAEEHRWVPFPCLAEENEFLINTADLPQDIPCPYITGVYLYCIENENKSGNTVRCEKCGKAIDIKKTL
jgi:hypothetical protein